MKMQLVDQNMALKKDISVAEKKLIARNERIQNLESLLQDSQEKLAQQNERFAHQMNEVGYISRFRS